MSSPKVSVLMPIWNTPEAYLREAMESILNQTYKDFEFLILNDSPDNTKLDEIIASYGDARVRYVRNERNMGITPSRNKLLRMAQGEYIAIFDHDDISLPERLEKQVAYLDAHPEVGVLSCGVRELPAGKEVHYPREDAEIRMGLMWGCMITHSAAMLRKSVLEESGLCYEEEFSPSEDYALWCRLIPHTRFYNMDDVLFCYRKHRDNTSKHQAERMKNATFAIRAFAAAENPALYQEYLMRAEHVERIKLFGVLPLLKRVRCGLRERVYLFDFILLYTSKRVIKMKV